MTRYLAFVARHPYLLAALVVVLFLPWMWMSYLIPPWALAISLGLAPLAAFIALAVGSLVGWASRDPDHQQTEQRAGQVHHGLHRVGKQADRIGEPPGQALQRDRHDRHRDGPAQQHLRRDAAGVPSSPHTAV